MPPAGFLSTEPEGEAFFRACQAAGMDGFRFGYLVVYRGTRQVAVAPYFLTDFHVSTLMPPGWVRRCLTGFRFKLACVGHPTTDFGRIEGEVSQETLTLISRALARKGRLVAFKGFGPALPLVGYVRARSLPATVLPLSPTYFQDMKSDRRNSLRRKLKKAATLRYKESDCLPDHLIDRVYMLYARTYDKAQNKLGKLTRDYFVESRQISQYLLFFDDDELIGFVQLIGKGSRLINRYVGLDYVKSHAYGLYFAMFIRSVEFGIREGYTEIELGATAYTFKRKLGAREVPTWNYFRHVSPIMHALLTRLRGVLEPSASDLL